MNTMTNNTKNAAYWKSHTEEEYNAEKNRLLDIVVPYMLHPDMYECPHLTYDEIALLISVDKDHVVSKMTICKIEQKVLAKMKRGLNKNGIGCVSDVLPANREGAWHIHAPLAKY